MREGQGNAVTAVAPRWVYPFGPGQTSQVPAEKDLLGGKGASLAAMSRAGLPVPPGFTITTECCRAFFDNAQQWPVGLEEEVRTHLTRLEEAVGRRFGADVRRCWSRCVPERPCPCPA